MKYQIELDFVERLLHNFHLSFRLIKKPFDPMFVPSDLGLRQLLKPDLDYGKIFEKLPQMYGSNTIYRIQDPSLCYYLIFQIPDPGETAYAVVGPYTRTVISGEILLEYFHKYSFPPEFLAQLEKYYQGVPYLEDDNKLLTLLFTLGERLWGSVDNFSIQDISGDSIINWEEAEQPMPNSKDSSQPFLSMKVLEKRYSDENELMQAISTGQNHKAQVLLNSFTSRQMERRVADSLRDKKNYSIILNTLLRKAAEAGSVHPLHIDRVSTQYARKIERCASPQTLESLNREMVHRYCLLVQNHSLKGYSLLVQKVITHVDYDLTADLSLYTQAKLLNVNSSYLSSLFKKETGVTLTEYVNKKRVKHAVFLLNTTTMPIQIIAQYSGIPDVNYFTKIFKKYIGKTPKEYRDSVTIPKHETP